MGKKETGGVVEVLLLKQVGGPRWRCLVSASKPARVGSLLLFSGNLTARVEKREDKDYVLFFSDENQVLNIGDVPLPPYIDRKPEAMDSVTYQTVYACHDGSVASPTAGLHFTQDNFKGWSHQYRGCVCDPACRPRDLHTRPYPSVEDHAMHPEVFSHGRGSSFHQQRDYTKRRIVAVEQPRQGSLSTHAYSRKDYPEKGNGHIHLQRISIQGGEFPADELPFA
jgi:S-adenosylmethionine:tRNA ribosyltransferase-isomerase